MPPFVQGPDEQVLILFVHVTHVPRPAKIAHGAYLRSVLTGTFQYGLKTAKFLLGVLVHDIAAHYLRGNRFQADNTVIVKGLEDHPVWAVSYLH